ncbi:uncharacterized protein LOC105775676 [Gossypium raimondii]|uniref:uncharacterized protein LOC105775676 n=1 Tax=Gossypium raimondii TaxID=29730 RepID=UPI00063ABB27|nr:uncharacterized protein LOC105775676 [Gossypium raimondii]
MREEETVKQYVDRIMVMVNSIRLLGEHFDEARIVEKVLSAFPKGYEAKISSLEDSRDLASISLTELINTFYAQEQRRASRVEDHQEGVFQAKAKEASSTNAQKVKKFWKNRPKPDAVRSNDQPCRHCKRLGHPEEKCWFRPDAICQHCKKKGHVERPKAEARVAKYNSDQEEQVFTVSCLVTGRSVQKAGYWTVADALICTPIGNKVISNVLLVPEINRNLLSIAQLLEKGYSVVFKDKQCQIADPSGSSLMTVTMTDKCFEVHWPNNSKSAYTASADDSKLWHQRLGHANFRSMAQMVSEGLAENFTNSVKNDEVCQDCHFLQTQHGKPLKDCSCSAQFQTICNDAGIKHQVTNVYTPQQNGVSERKNISLMDMARCLLFEKKLLKTMWAEVVNTAVYLQNRLSTKALAQKTPFEAWFGFKPSLAHLKVFGCLCYAQIPAVKRDKLSKRSQPGILECWNWEKNELEAVSEELVPNQAELEQIGPEMDIDDVPVRGTRSLDEVYERAQIAIAEPTSFEEAEADEGWKQAMVDEINMIRRRTRHGNGSLNKLKARLVVKGFSQRYCLDYLETFAPVARLDTIRLLVALAAQNQWTIHQMDVKSVFLNGFLEEEIYIE